MDFWSRLIAGSGRGKHISAEDSRLSRFKREIQVLQASKKSITTTPSTGLVANVKTSVGRLLSLLKEDARTPAQSTLAFATASHFYTDVCSLVARLDNSDLTRVTVSLLSFLLNTEESLLSSDVFARAAIEIIISVTSSQGQAREDLRSAVLEFSFDIAAKLRVQTDAVNAWFTEAQDEEGFVTRTQIVLETVFEAPVDGTEFRLISHFLDHVYEEGKPGDLARTGLLYMFDCATRSDKLESWIVDSDLSRLLASGLGALYSQLSRKLTIAHPSHDLPIIIALSEQNRTPEETDIESLYSPETQARLSTFTSYLTYWRDMIGRCRSVNIKATLIDNFHVFFLQQILYPSILQSSDVDGGSAVAVLSYCSFVLESLQQEDLIHHMLHYLLALPGTASSRPLTPISPDRPRSSRAMMALQEAQQAHEKAMNPSFFSLVDLILASLDSNNAEALTAALRLVSRLLQQHHSYTLGSLVRISTIKQASAKRTIGVLRQETASLVELATAFGGDIDIDASYSNSLQDALAMIESHDCSREHPALKFLDGTQSEEDDTPLPSLLPEVSMHRLRMDDPLMLALLSLMDQFFINDIEVNLALTEVLAHLAACPYIRLEGWLAVEPSVFQTIKDVQSSNFEESEIYTGVDEDELERQRIKAYRRVCQPPKQEAKHASSLVTILHKLQVDLKQATANIVDFKQLVASRRRAFEGAAEMEDDAAKMSPRMFKSMRSRSSIASPQSPTSGPSPNDTGGSVRGRGIAEMMGLPPIYGLIAGSGSMRSKPSKGTILPQSPTVNTGALPPRLKTKASVPAISPLSPLRTPPMVGEFNVFEQYITFGLGQNHTTMLTLQDHDIDPFDDIAGDQHKTTLSRVLTNVILLQNFILELSAIMQVRAGLFDGDVSFG